MKMILNEDIIKRLEDQGVKGITLLDNLVKYIPMEIKVIQSGQVGIAYPIEWHFKKYVGLDGGTRFMSTYTESDRLSRSYCTGISKNPSEAVGITIAKLLEDGYAELRDDEVSGGNRLVPIVVER